MLYTALNLSSVYLLLEAVCQCKLAIAILLYYNLYILQLNGF